MSSVSNKSKSMVENSKPSNNRWVTFEPDKNTVTLIKTDQSLFNFESFQDPSFVEWP